MNIEKVIQNLLHRPAVMMLIFFALSIICDAIYQKISTTLPQVISIACLIVVIINAIVFIYGIIRLIVLYIHNKKGGV